VLLMALVAMSLRAAMPAGYMLSDSNGQVVVSLCNGGSMTLDLGKTEHGKQTHHDAPCPYAAAAHAAAPPTDAIAIALQSAAIVAATPRDVRPGRGLAAPPPPATGPPTLS
jgi:hypothetical protein